MKLSRSSVSSTRLVLNLDSLVPREDEILALSPALATFGTPDPFTEAPVFRRQDSLDEDTTEADSGLSSASMDSTWWLTPEFEATKFVRRRGSPSSVASALSHSTSFDGRFYSTPGKGQSSFNGPWASIASDGGSADGLMDMSGPPTKQDDVGRTQASQGDEHCTTLMLQNLPTGFSEEVLTRMLEAMGLKGLFDYVYVPMTKRSPFHRNFAFVNFVTPEVARNFRARCHGCKFSSGTSEKTLLVFTAHHQVGPSGQPHPALHRRAQQPEPHDEELQQAPPMRRLPPTHLRQQQDVLQHLPLLEQLLARSGGGTDDSEGLNAVAPQPLPATRLAVCAAPLSAPLPTAVPVRRPREPQQELDQPATGPPRNPTKVLENLIELQLAHSGHP